MSSADRNLPADDESLAADAAMQREWAKIRDLVSRLAREAEEDEHSAEAQRTMALLAGFIERHRAALLARGGDPDRLSLGRLGLRLQEYIEAELQYQRAADEFLVLTANRADTEHDLVVSLLSDLQRLEALPPKSWEAMTEAERTPAEESLAELRAHRESLLAELPLAEREEWERRLT